MTTSEGRDQAEREGNEGQVVGRDQADHESNEGRVETQEANATNYGDEATEWAESEGKESAFSQDQKSALDKLSQTDGAKKNTQDKEALVVLANEMIEDLDVMERKMMEDGTLSQEQENELWAFRNNLVNLRRKTMDTTHDPAWENRQWGSNLRGIARFAVEYGATESLDKAEEVAKWTTEEVKEKADQAADWVNKQYDYNVNMVEECFSPGTTILSCGLDALENFAKDLKFLENGKYEQLDGQTLDADHVRDKNVIGGMSMELEAEADTVTAYVDTEKAQDYFFPVNEELAVDGEDDRGMIIYTVDRVGEQEAANFAPESVAIITNDEGAAEGIIDQGAADERASVIDPGEVDSQTVKGKNVIYVVSDKFESATGATPTDVKVSADSVTIMGYDQDTKTYHKSGTYRAQAVVSIPAGRRRQGQMAMAA